MSADCRGCEGTCCTGQGSEPCTCPEREHGAPGPILKALLAALGDSEARPGPQGAYLTRCPGHDDERPSLSVREFSGGAVIHCHAGCSADEVLAVLGMSRPDLITKS